MSDIADAPARSPSDSPRIFENNLLDRFSRIDHRVPMVVYGPIVAVLAVWSLLHAGAAVTVGGLLGGYVFWTLVEYFGHRYIFHWEPPGKLGARLHFLIHGVHHIYPSDPLRLVMARPTPRAAKPWRASSPVMSATTWRITMSTMASSAPAGAAGSSAPTCCTISANPSVASASARRGGIMCSARRSDPVRSDLGIAVAAGLV